MARPLGYKPSAAARAKQSASMMGKLLPKSPEHRAKISASMVGMVRGPSTDEHKLRQRIAMLRRLQPDD